MKRKKIIIMGAAGRDFHNFNVCFRNNPSYQVMAFTAAQIPYITNRNYPPSLAGSLYPQGIPIFEEAQLPDLIKNYGVEEVIFAYSDLSHNDLMHKASLVLAIGSGFRLLGPDATMLKSRRPVISVCAVRTGAGKSPVTRYISEIIMRRCGRSVVIRHPMPYGNLSEQEVERFAERADLSLHQCTIEEREEFEPLLAGGAVVFAGVDYQKVLWEAEKEGEVLLWDGGNNDFPFFHSDLEITVVDPLREGHETAYFPGEVNLRRADVVIIGKINLVESEVVQRMEHSIRSVNPDARIVPAASEIVVDNSAAITGKNVLVVEDGPTITHGGLPGGAGLAAAKKFSAGGIVDPRPFAVNSIAEVYRKYPHIGAVLPAMGYSDAQIQDLRKTIEGSPCDLVISATPVDLGRLVTLDKPIVRVTYNMRELEGEMLKQIVTDFLDAHGY